MVVEAIMNMLKKLILFIIGLFPTFPSLSFLREYIDTFVSVVKSVNQFISIPTLGACFMAILLCYNARAVWSIIMWVIRKIPGVQ